MLVGGSYFGVKEFRNKQELSKTQQEEEKRVASEKDTQTQAIISEQQKALEEAKVEIEKLKAENTPKVAPKTAPAKSHYIPVSERSTGTVSEKNTQVEMEKCRYKYLISQEFDSLEDMHLIIYQSNYVTEQLQAKGRPVGDPFTTLKDGYFDRKYQECLDKI